MSAGSLSGNGIRFLLGDQTIELQNVDPHTTVLEWLRTSRHLTGTKEGCAEGDCGACTVVLAESRQGKVTWRAVNACIQLLPFLHGKQILTIEHLAGENPGGPELHPVQQAMVRHHGSQCGFCTPGIVMSLFAESRNVALPGETSRERTNRCLAGNLCRCTGYTSIAAAAEDTWSMPGSEGRITPDVVASTETFEALDGGEDFKTGTAGRVFHSPVSLLSLLTLLQEHPGATLVAGATDLGLWINKDLRTFDRLIYTGRVRELLQLESDDDQIRIGAAVTYTDAIDTLCSHYPALRPMMERLGAVQVRNAGTIGGNIANGSPIGDMPPPLIALGAELLISGPAGQRALPLEDFFIEYGRQDLDQGEVVHRIHIPLPRPDQHFRVYKLSKREGQDISAVCGAFSADLSEGRLRNVRICFGGMAGTPARAPGTEDLLEGQRPDEPGILAGASNALAGDYQPISDWRASREYRSRSATALLQRFLGELAR